MSELYLTRIRLREGAVHSAEYWAPERRFDAHHKLVWSFFAKNEEGRDFLYRVEGSGASVCFYTLSRRRPVDTSGLWEIDTPRVFAPRLQAGQLLEFTLRANPVRRSFRDLTEESRKRVERREKGTGGHRFSTDQKHDVVMLERKRLEALNQEAPREPDLVQQQGELWLREQAKRAGFEVLRVNADSYQQMQLWRAGRREAAIISTIDFAGVLRVTDPERMITQLWAGQDGEGTSVQPGLGSARAFGCGLMLVRRVVPSWGEVDEDDA